MKRLLILLTISTLLFGCDQNKKGAVKQTLITIGTGGLTGVYYPTGQAIAKLIINSKVAPKVKATAESTGGSVYNINALSVGELDFAVAQSDRTWQAAQGQMDWENSGPQANLRVLFGLHTEAITLIASEASSVKSVQDLKGKRINLGNPGSGQLGNSKDALKAFGIGLNDIKPEYIKAIEAPGLLQDERLDAFFYTVGHPNGNLKEATSGRQKSRFIALEGQEVDLLILKYPFYSKTSIPISHYPSALNKEDVATVGVKALFLTNSNMDEKIVYNMVKEVFENLENFKKLHPSFKDLSKDNMLLGLTAPIHKGALKYYKEQHFVIPAQAKSQTTVLQ